MAPANDADCIRIVAVACVTRMSNSPAGRVMSEQVKNLIQACLASVTVLAGGEGAWYLS